MPAGVWIIAAASLCLVAFSVATARRSRRRLLARIRGEWGRPRVRDRLTGLIAGYFRFRAPALHPGTLVDDRTWEDLNLDAVFAFLDRTESTVGQQVLYQRLRRAPEPGPGAFEALVCRMAGDASTRERAQLALAALQDPAGYDLWWLTQPDAIERRQWHMIYPLAAVAMLAAAVAALIWPGVFLLLIAGAVLNLIVRGMTAARVFRLVAPLRQLSVVLAVAESLVFLDAAGSSPLTGNLRQDLSSLRRLKRIVRSLGPDPLTSGEIVALLMEYLNLLFLLDVNAAYFAAGDLRRCGATLLRVVAAVGEIDAAISVASVRAGAGEWIRPVFVPPGSPLRLEAVRHPLIADPVPNSLELGPGRSVLITGSNMSGKTTFLRTAGVNAVLAQSLNTCFARAYEAPVVCVRSCIGAADDLLSGKSYYLTEVEAVLSAVGASHDVAPHLFLLDELFRGTNAVERIAAAEAVLCELVLNDAKPKPHYVLAATHEDELVGFVSEVYAAFHFADEFGPDGLKFDYQLRQGVTDSRNGLALLRLHGAPERMVVRAFERAAVLQRMRTGQASIQHPRSGR